MDKQVENLSVEQIKKGGDRLFSELYVQNREVFMKYAMRYIKDEEELRDIYQDSFMVFYRNIMNGRLTELTSKVSTYVISIGRNKIFERLRSKKSIVDNELALEFAADEAVSTDHLQFERTEMTHEQQLLYKHFPQLGESCQEIIKNFYFHGLTIAEIKEIGNYNSENVVKAQKSRCLKKLKELIKN